MTISNSRLSYEDCYKVMDAALDDSLGARVEMNTMDEATFFRMRIHTARSIDRRDNSQLYPTDHPLHGRSPYDKLVTRIRVIDDKIWIYVEQIGINLGEVEALSEVQSQLPPPPKHIEAEPAPLMIEQVKRRV